MRQAETKDRQAEKEEKRQTLVHSSHWVIPSKGGFTEDSPEVTRSESIGFSDILEISGSDSTTQNGRRGYGKFANKV